MPLIRKKKTLLNLCKYLQRKENLKKHREKSHSDYDDIPFVTVGNYSVGLLSMLIGLSQLQNQENNIRN
jgi:hypothetical protein